MLRKKSLLINLLIFGLFLNTQAQTIDLQKKITVVQKKQTLSAVLNEIHKKAGINFSYNNADIDNLQRVTLIARNKPVKNVLYQLFSGLDINYTVVEKQIVLKKNQYALITVIPEVKKEPKKYSISGYVKDSIDNEVLIGAGVSIKSTYFGAVTNAYGYYSIS